MPNNFMRRIWKQYLRFLFFEFYTQHFFYYRLFMDQQLQFKISLVGNTSTGKTQFVRTLNGETNSTLKTIGCQHTSTIVTIPVDRVDKQVRLSLWDCGGSRQYEALINTYTRNSDLIMLFGSPYDPNSLEENKRLLGMLKSQDGGSKKKNIVLVKSIRSDWQTPAGKDLEILALQHNLEVEIVDAKNVESCNRLIKKMAEKLYRQMNTDVDMRKEPEQLGKYQKPGRMFPDTPWAWFIFGNIVGIGITLLILKAQKKW